MSAEGKKAETAARCSHGNISYLCTECFPCTCKRDKKDMITHMNPKCLYHYPRNRT